MYQWRQWKWLHALLMLSLVLSISVTTVSGMLIYATREYDTQDTSQFYISQSQFYDLLDEHLRIFEQYMEIGSVIAPDGMIDYDTLLLTSVSDPEKGYTLKDLLRMADRSGLYANEFRNFTANLVEQAEQQISYPWKTQYYMNSKDQLVIADDELYQFIHSDGHKVGETQYKKAKPYLNNMVLIDSMEQQYYDQLTDEISLKLPSFPKVSLHFKAETNYEKYLITFFPEYSKWYYFNTFYQNAKIGQGVWSNEFQQFCQEFQKEFGKDSALEEIYEKLEKEVSIVLESVPESKMPWKMHRAPRSLNAAAEYAVFLVETYQEMQYFFADSSFAFAYEDTSGIQLVNDTDWWDQVQKIVQTGTEETATDQTDILYAYYAKRDFMEHTNLLQESLNMSGNIQEKLIDIGTNYLERSFTIAIGVNLQAVRQGTHSDDFVRQYETSRTQADLSEIGKSAFIPAFSVMLVVLLLLLLRCGHDGKQGELILRSFDHIWLEPVFLLVLFFGQVYWWLLRLWSGSLTRFEFILVGIALSILGCFGMIFLISIVKRIKVGIFWKQSIIVYFLYHKIVRRLPLRNVWHRVQELYWDLPILGRYIMLFIMEGLWLGYLVSFFLWADGKLQHRMIKAFFTRFGISVIIVFGLGILVFIIWQIHCYHTGQMNRKMIQSVRLLAEGDFTKRLDKPVGISYERAVFIDLLNQIGVSFEQAVEESIKNERFKTELIANVSHDIKTPLTSVINYVDLIKRQSVDNLQIREYIEILDRKSHRLKTLIEDLIEASKASSGAIELNISPLDFNELVVQTTGEFEDLFAEAGLELITETMKQPVHFLGDGRKVYRVLENLYMNVRKYALKGTRVYVKLEKRRDQVVFAIKNTSAARLNITPEELTERFVRGDSSRTTEGSGLGLSIAKSLTELMDGEFEIFLDGDLFRAEVRFRLERDGERDGDEK